jgi:hypothetical protein
MDRRKRLNLLKTLVSFQENEFVFVQILQRRKDNPELELGVKRIKSFTFYSWEELEKQFDRIVELCDLNNARAYIRLNKQNSVDVSLRCIEEISKNLRLGHPDNNRNVWDSVSGQGGKKDYWVLDLDTEHMNLLDSIGADLATHFTERFLKSHGDDPEMAEFACDWFPIEVNRTKSGVHLITRAFDTRILDKYNKELSAKQLPTIQIQKDANTILYIGNTTND